MSDTIKVTIEMPAHLRQMFLNVMSACAEQTFMECYHDHDFSENKCITFDYPGWNDKIVITEHDQS